MKLLKNTTFFAGLLLIGLSLGAADVSAANIKVKGKFSTGTQKLLALQSSKTARSTSSTKSHTVTLKSATSSAIRLYALSSTSKATAIVAAIKYGNKYLSVADAIKKRTCRKSSAVAVMAVKTSAGKTIDVGTIKGSASSGYYLDKRPAVANLVKSATAAVSNSCKIEKSSTYGLGTSESAALRLQKNERAGIKVGDSTDSDGDGLASFFDVDDDGDGVLDNYDSSSGSPAPTSNTMVLFSNLKLPLEATVNVNALRTASVSDEDILTSINSAMQNNTTLAISVAGSESSSVELNCGSLTYCSTGGTGTYQSQPYPGALGGIADPDSDGFGLMVRGGTGDFQLSTGASSTAIGAGDVLTEIVDQGTSGAYEVSGALNFVFNTNPAVKNIQINSETPSTYTYPVASGQPGTTNNCIAVPASGDVVVTLDMWRPQRPAVTGAGETDYMDIGNSLITIDIPNGAFADGLSSSVNGPGNCEVGYATSDTELSLATDSGTGAQTLSDTAADTAADAANLASFSIDITACLAADSVTWAAGENIAFDVQFRNSTGDNAAQKICLRRADS